MRAIFLSGVGMGMAGMMIISGCAPLSSHEPVSASGGDGALPSGPAAPLVAPPPPPSSTAPARKPAAVKAAVSSEEPLSPAADPDGGAFSFDNFELVDAGLKGKLAPRRVGSARTSTNLLSVFAGLKNLTAHSLRIEVQTLYKDKADSPLHGGKAGWIPMTLKPHEETEYRSASISEEAVDFLVRVRSASGGHAAEGR